MDYYEKCFYQNIIYRYLIIYIYEYSISNTSSFEINWVFLVGGGGKIIPLPLIKHWVGGPLPPASLTCLAGPCNNSNLYGLGNAIQWKIFKI